MIPVREGAHTSKRYYPASIFLAAILLVGMLTNFLFGYVSDIMKIGKQITDAETISWCENTKPNAYPIVKEELANLIKNETGFVPHKLAFVIRDSNPVVKNYTVKVYYQTKNGCWYEKSLDCTKIYKYNPELDRLLCAIHF